MLEKQIIFAVLYGFDMIFVGGEFGDLFNTKPNLS